MVDQASPNLVNSTVDQSTPYTVSTLIPPESTNLSTKKQNYVLADNSSVSPMKSKRVGETVLLSLLAIGNAGPAKIEVGVLSTVLKALLAIGLDQDARALALEAALVNGL
jgi:hypothetical protein